MCCRQTSDFFSYVYVASCDLPHTRKMTQQPSHGVVFAIQVLFKLCSISSYANKHFLRSFFRDSYYILMTVENCLTLFL